MPNNNITDDLDFDLPPLPKIRKPGEFSASPPPPPPPKPARHMDMNDILAAPDAAGDYNPSVDKAPQEPEYNEANDPLADYERFVQQTYVPGAAPPPPEPPRQVFTAAAEEPAPQQSYETAAGDTAPAQDTAPEQEEYPGEDETIDYVQQGYEALREEESGESYEYPAHNTYSERETVDPAEQEREKPAYDTTGLPLTGTAARGQTIGNIDISEDTYDDDELPSPQFVEAKKKREQEFVGSYEQKNKGNFVIGDDDDDDDTDDSYDSDLSGIDKSKIILEDMDKGKKRQMSSKTLRNQLIMDDISMDLEEIPVLEDLSNEYSDMKQKVKNVDYSTKEGKLGDNERRAIKDHLREEINRRPENFNKNASNAMAKNLMHEKRVKKAKKGFLFVILVMFLALASAGAMFVGIGLSDMDYAQLFKYLSIGIVVFAVSLMIKSKPLKTLSSVVFILITLTTLILGLVLHALNHMEDDPNFNIHVVWYISSALLSGLSAFFLISSETIDTYYTTDTRH